MITAAQKNTLLTYRRRCHKNHGIVFASIGFVTPNPLTDEEKIKRKEDIMPRKRQNKIAFYLNDEEYARLLELEEKLKINRSTLFRYLIWHQQITVPPENFNELIIELKRIGNNLNQLARAANTKGFLNGNELREELYALRKCESDLQKAFPVKRR